MKNIILLLAALVIACTAQHVVAQSVHFVDVDRSPGGDGSSWSAAFDDLQDALAVASEGDQIWVAEGVYTPGITVSDSFVLSRDIVLYGGFDGTESNPGDRAGGDTVLSGDLGAGVHAYHVVSAFSEVNQTTVLDRFSIRDGLGVYTGQHNMETQRGAGVYCIEAKLEFVDCYFFNNHVPARSSPWNGQGGAVYASFSNVTRTLAFTRCQFGRLVGPLDEGNQAGTGGAIYFYGASENSRFNLVLTDCLFWANRATGMSGQSCNSNTEGGAVYVENSDAGGFVRIRNCDFWDNYSHARGGAVLCGGPDLEIEDTEFLNNRSAMLFSCVGGFGGAVYFSGESERTFECLRSDFEGNYSTKSGGAIYYHSGSESLFYAYACTFTNNYVYPNQGTPILSGGAIYLTGPSSRIVWCDFEDNTANSTNGKGGAINLNSPYSVELLWSNFTDNSAHAGGALFLNGDTDLAGCEFRSNTSTSNGGAVLTRSRFDAFSSVFWQNGDYSSQWGTGPAAKGGAIFGERDFGLTPEITLVNCTVADNNASIRGGGIYLEEVGGSFDADNSVLWHNAAGLGTLSEQQVFGELDTTIEIEYSDIEGGYSGAGNISGDPLFVNLSAGDIRLGGGSPCLDAAELSLIPSDIDLDIDDDSNNPAELHMEWDAAWNSRMQCGDVDMGAYEFVCDCSADWNNDGVVNTLDFFAFLMDWGNGQGDINGDGLSDLYDQFAFLRQWESGC